MVGDDAAVISLRADEGSAPRRAAVHEIDDRWLLAYAVAVGDSRPVHLDLDRPGGITAHPVFPVCLEWPLIAGGPPGVTATEEALHRGLHVGHRIELHVPLRPGRLVRSEAVLSRAEQHGDATLLSVEFRTWSAADRLLITSRMDTLFLRTALSGGTLAGSAVPRGVSTPQGSTSMQPLETTGVDATNAVVYSECSRIWNPIHTDVRVARAAGLPTTVLHGTEVLARAVSAICRSVLVPPGATVSAVECRFTGLVVPGETLTTLAAADGERSVTFEVRTSGGTTAVSAGRVDYRV